MTRQRLVEILEDAYQESDNFERVVLRAYDLGRLAMARELAKKRTQSRDHESFSDWAKGYDFGHDRHAELCGEIGQRLARRLKGKG